MSKFFTVDGFRAFETEEDVRTFVEDDDITTPFSRSDLIPATERSPDLRHDTVRIPMAEIHAQCADAAASRIR